MSRGLVKHRVQEENNKHSVPALTIGVTFFTWETVPRDHYNWQLDFCRYFHNSAPRSLSQPQWPEGSQVLQHPWWQLGGGDFSRITECSPPWPLLSRGNPTLRRSCQLTLVCIPWIQDHWAQIF